MSSLIVNFAEANVVSIEERDEIWNTISGNTRRFTLRIVRSPNSPSDSTDVRGSGHGGLQS